MTRETKPPQPCDVPPPGWSCSRGAGHPGPCAARPTLADPADGTCGIPAGGGMLGRAPCDKPWGHPGDMHANGGDGFYSRVNSKEHKRRQSVARSNAASEDFLNQDGPVVPDDDCWQMPDDPDWTVAPDGTPPPGEFERQRRRSGQKVRFTTDDLDALEGIVKRSWAAQRPLDHDEACRLVTAINDFRDADVRLAAMESAMKWAPAATIPTVPMKRRLRPTELAALLWWGHNYCEGGEADDRGCVAHSAFADIRTDNLPLELGVIVANFLAWTDGARERNYWRRIAKSYLRQGA